MNARRLKRPLDALYEMYDETFLSPDPLEIAEFGNI